MAYKSLLSMAVIRASAGLFAGSLAFLLCSLIDIQAKAEPVAKETQPSTNKEKGRSTTASSDDAAGGRAGHMAMKPQKGVVSLDIFENHGKIYLLTLNNRSAGQALILQTSTDSGKSWSNELPIPIPEGSGVQASRGADARIAKIGNTLIVMWMSHVSGAPHGAGPMVVMRSIDDGKSWTASTLAADWSQGPHGFMSLSANGKYLHATWLDSREGKPAAPGSQGLRYAVSADKGVTWSKNQTLDQSACACCWTTIRTDRDGKAYVLYRDKQPSDMAIGVVDEKNHIWTRLSTVGAFNWDFPGCPHIGGGLAFRQNGKLQELHAVVGTRKKESAGIYHLRSQDGGKSWSTPTKLGDDTSTHADIESNNNGGVTAVWDMIDADAADGSMAIYASSSLNGTDWLQPVRLSEKNTSATHPRAISTKGGVLVLWTEHSADEVMYMKSKIINTK